MEVEEATWDASHSSTLPIRRGFSFHPTVSRILQDALSLNPYSHQKDMTRAAATAAPKDTAGGDIRARKRMFVWLQAPE
ncbi:MAG: hypothetical protein Q9226_002685 [Calogaya cf. arnoldii]